MPALPPVALRSSLVRPCFILPDSADRVLDAFLNPESFNEHHLLFHGHHVSVSFTQQLLFFLLLDAELSLSHYFLFFASFLSTQPLFVSFLSPHTCCFPSVHNRPFSFPELPLMLLSIRSQ